MAMRSLTVLVLCGAALAGCTTMQTTTMSYVAPEITATDASFLAADVVEHLARPLPPAQTTIVLDPPVSQNSDTMTGPLREQLQSTGYGVVETAKAKASKPATPQGVPLRYLVSPLESGVLMRLQYQGAEAARFYPRGTDGALLEATPFMIRGASGD